MAITTSAPVSVRDVERVVLDGWIERKGTGLTAGDIADALGCSTTSVRRRLSEAVTVEPAGPRLGNEPVRYQPSRVLLWTELLKQKHAA